MKKNTARAMRTAPAVMPTAIPALAPEVRPPELFDDTAEVELSAEEPPVDDDCAALLLALTLVVTVED